MHRLRPLHAPVYLLAVVALAALSFACAPVEEEPMEEAMIEEEVVEEPMTATAVLQGAEGTGITGTVTFVQTGNTVAVNAHVDGAAGAGTHGFHVHETGDCSAPDFTSAGGHFNPDGRDHACPPTTPRHAGDFGNLEVGEDGSGHLEATSDAITVADEGRSVVGKAVVLHADADDCTSQPSGAAGARIACGVIEAAGDGMTMDGDDEMMGDDGEMGEGGEYDGDDDEG